VLKFIFVCLYLCGINLRKTWLFHRRSRFILTAWLSFLLTVFNPTLLLLSAPPTQAAVVSNLPLRAVATNSNDSSPVLLPDWQSISFSSMPPIGESGSIDLPTGGVRQWTAGQTPDKYLQLGDIDEALRPDLASLSSIAQMVSNLDLKQTALNSFPLAGQQTLKHLADIVPSLAGLSVDRIPPVATLLSSSGIALPNTSTTLSKLLQQYPQLGNLQLKSIDLSKFSISSIPNLDLVQLGQFKDWQSSLINQIPGLKDLPLAYFPQPLIELGDVVARIDSIYSKAERERQRTVSGSNAVGFSYPCSGQDCAYIELDDLENQGRNTHSSFEGRSWISGKYQKVPGGSGCLKWVNGGKEPTGRHPFGKAFKVAVMEPDEKTDTVNTALFFRFKNLCGATPYFVGPVPFITYSLNDPIFVGIWDADKDSNSGTATPNSTSTASKETQPSATTPSAADSTQPEPQDCNDANFDPTNTVQNVAIEALADAIATTESDAVYDAIGPFTVADRGQDRGRALGMYQMMSYEPSVVAAVSRHSGGDTWLQDLSKGKQPTKDELLTYFPPAEQEAVFRQLIKDKIETTAAEIDPTTGELFAGDRLVQRVAQKYFGGDSSGVDSGATDSFGRLNTYTYGLNVSQQYSQQLGLADNWVPCTTINDSTDSAGTTTNTKESSVNLPAASNSKKSNTRSGTSGRTTSYPDRQTLLAYISPADLLDYFGLTYDIVERMYIELNYKEGQEKDFALLMNAIATALDAIGVVVPGAGGGGTSFRAAMAVAPASAAAIWRTIPAAAKQRIYAEVAKTLGWSSARAVQMTNAFFSAMNAEGGAGGGSGNSGEGNTGSPEEPDLETPPTYANETVRNQWKNWSSEVRQQYIAAQERIKNSRDLVRRMSDEEYKAIFDEGRGTTQDVFPTNVEQNKVFSLDREYQFSNTTRNTGSGYERVVRIQLTDELKAFLKKNLAPDNLPGGLKSGIRTLPRYKLERGDYNIVIPKSSWNEFKRLIQNHTVN